MNAAIKRRKSELDAKADKTMKEATLKQVKVNSTAQSASELKIQQANIHKVTESHKNFWKVIE